jgi:DNA-binding FrmR family transcriptional regulator
MPGYESDKEQLAKRLARIEGQVRGIAKMIEDDRYCIDILDQVSAVSKGLKVVALHLTREHLGHCVSESIKSDADGGIAKLDEAVSAIERLVKS